MTDYRVVYFVSLYEDGTRITHWQCQRCKTIGGTTNQSLSELHFGAHWKGDTCNRALRMLRERGETLWIQPGS